MRQIYPRPRNNSNGDEKDNQQSVSETIQTQHSRNQLSHRQNELFKILNVDPHIFEETTNDSYTPPSADDMITAKNLPLLRLCVAMRYFDILRELKWSEEIKRNLFIEFNQTIYLQLIDDTAYLVQKHSEDIQQIHREWITSYGLAECAVSDCSKTTRHHQRGRAVEDDSDFSFYRSLFDRVHFFVFHLFDVGLRIDHQALLKDKGNEDNDGTSGLTVDRLVAASRDHIKSRRKELGLDSGRFDPENSKFTIHNANTSSGQSRQTTWTDACFEDWRIEMWTQRLCEKRQRILNTKDMILTQSNSMWQSPMTRTLLF